MSPDQDLSLIKYCMAWLGSRAARTTDPCRIMQ